MNWLFCIYFCNNVIDIGRLRDFFCFTESNEKQIVEIFTQCPQNWKKMERYPSYDSTEQSVGDRTFYTEKDHTTKLLKINHSSHCRKP